MFTHQLRHSRSCTFSTSPPEGLSTLCGYLTLSLLIHLALFSIIAVQKMNADPTPRKSTVIEIDLSRIAATHPQKVSSQSATISGPDSAEHKSYPSRFKPIPATRPLPVKTVSKIADLRPLEPGPGTSTDTRTAETNTGITVPGTETAATTAGTQGMRSGNGGEDNGDRSEADGQQTKVALAEYSRVIRALIERHKEYPPAAKKLGIHGSVTVSFSLNCNGELQDVSLVKSSNNSMLDNAAIRSVRTVGRFPSPPRRAPAGKNLSFRIPITFALTSS